jgi:ZIP family zinc transporter
LSLTTILLIAGLAAVASPLGGLLAFWRRPSTLFTSLAVGFASGVLMAAIAFEMMPKALEQGSLPVAALGFIVGFAAVYGFDLFIHRGRLAGAQAEEYRQVAQFHRRHRPRGGEITVLAGGTSAEELIEGLSIGVGAVIQPGVGLLIALAILVDNVSEGLSIGELIRAEQTGDGRAEKRRVLGWTGLIGLAVFVSALAGWLFLRDLPSAVLGFLFAVGAGGMFYLTITDLVPQAEERQYQQSGAIAAGLGFAVIFCLSAVI